MSSAEDPTGSLVSMAEALLDVGRYDEAATRARDAIAGAPEDPRPYRTLSRALYGADENQEAADVAREAIRLAPEDGAGYRLCSRALTVLAQESGGNARAVMAGEAVDCGKAAVRLAPSDPNSHLVLAEALCLIQAFDAANKEVQQVIRLAPNSEVTWVSASLVAIRQRNWSAAIDACERALAIEPNSYAALNNLGVALRASGRQGEGTRVLAQAARVDPNSLTARRNLSRAGIRIARIAVLVVLIPIGFVTNLGLLLYFVFAIGSNVLISARPDLVLRLERWTAPIALAWARRPGPKYARLGVDARDPVGKASGGGAWSSAGPAHRVRSSLLALLAGALWLVTLIALVVLAAVPGWGRLVAAAGALVVAGAALWPTMILVRRRS